MNIIVDWWSWKNGKNERTIVLPKIRNGYLSKKAWERFETQLKDLDGKKVRVKIQEDESDGRNTIQLGGTKASKHGGQGTGRGPDHL